MEHSQRQRTGRVSRAVKRKSAPLQPTAPQEGPRPIVTKTDRTVVLYTKKNDSGIQQHISLLNKNGIEAVPVRCTRRSSFIGIDITQYSRVDLMVDRMMCHILMEDEELHRDVKMKFKEVARSGKNIYVINKLPPGKIVFQELFFSLPGTARHVLKDGQWKEEASSGDATQGSSMAPISGSTGMTGGKASRSNIAGTVGGSVHYGDIHNTVLKTNEYKTTKHKSRSNIWKRKITTEYDKETSPEIDLNKVHIDVDFESGKENTFYLQLTDNEVKLTTNGVKSAKITRGSVNITLTMEEDFIITEDWIQDVLRIIFDDILGAYIEEGESFQVNVARYVSIPDPTLHGNCVSKEEYMKQVEKVRKLEKQVTELELEKKTLLQQEMQDAKVMLYIKHRTSVDDETSSGIHSADLSTEVSGTEGETSRRQEETLPTKTALQEVHDTSATLIYYNTDQMLQEACRAGQLEVVKSLLSTGRVDINSRGEAGVTPVLIAAGYGNKQLFDLLVKNGCDLSLSLDNGNNILHLACFGGCNEIVDYIISNRIVDIENRGYLGRTAVMKAAGAGKMEVFQLLVAKGCNPAEVDDQGNNILHVACYSGNLEIVDYIISQNITDKESRGFIGRTPILAAAEHGRKNVFDHLVSINCNMSVVDDNGNDILHVACFSDNVEIVDYLIYHNITDKENRGYLGRTPIMTAADRGRKRVFDFLVSIGCSLSAVDDDGANILHFAAHGGNVSIVEQILTDPTIDINSRTKMNRTPLWWARKYKQVDVDKLLVEIGASM